MAARRAGQGEDKPRSSSPAPVTRKNSPGRASSFPADPAREDANFTAAQNSTDSGSSAAASAGGVARRGLIVQWQSWVPCCYEAPPSDNDGSWIGLKLGKHKSIAALERTCSLTRLAYKGSYSIS